MRKIKNNLICECTRKPVNPQAGLPNNRPIKEGFTLIELLVATTILAGVTLAVFFVFSAGLKVYARVQSLTHEQADVLAALEGLETDLRNTFNLTTIGFTGDSKIVEFAGLVRQPGSTTNKNLYLGKIAYYFDAKKNIFVRDEQAYPYSADGLRSRLLASVKNINLSYYSFNSQSQECEWVDSLSPSNQDLPLAVKVKIQFRKENVDTEVERTIFMPVAAKSS